MQFLKWFFRSGPNNEVLSQTLFEEHRPEISICVTVGIKPDGSLEVAGHDQGKLVLELQETSDYEYYLLVAPGPKQELKEKLGLEGYKVKTDLELLSWFQQHYSKNEAFSAIAALLKQHDIKHDVSFW